MPSNDGNKLIQEEEVRLPVATNNSTTTNTTTTNGKSVNHNSNINFKDFLQEPLINSTIKTQAENTSIQHLAQIHTISTTKPLDDSQVRQQQEQQQRDDNLNTIRIEGLRRRKQQQQHSNLDSPNLDEIASSPITATKFATTSLYPTVIYNIIPISPVYEVYDYLDAFESANLNNKVNNQSNNFYLNHLEALSLKIQEENDRCAFVKAKIFNDTNATTITNNNDESKLNYPVAQHNAINANDNKRKRLDSVALPDTNGHKSPARKRGNLTGLEKLHELAQAAYFDAQDSDDSLDFWESEVIRRPESLETIKLSTLDFNNNMSLYERRYARDDGGRSSSSGIVSNGFLSSATTTRNSSAASSAADTAVADDIQTSSAAAASQQYFMSPSDSSALVSAGTTNSASIAANGSSVALHHAPSMATLCNIGNTCYLNSVVYTLRFAPQFLHNLHHLIVDLGNIQQNIVRQQRAKSSSLGRNMSAMHMENARSWSSKDLASLEQYGGSAMSASSASASSTSTAAAQFTQKSCHQLLTERLHELYQSLHRNEVIDSTEPFHADTLLHAIQDVSSIFEGNQQQDAHEFLMCVLNSIRETCQTLIKAIDECPDVILNGYISNPDEVDATLEKDAVMTTSNSHVASGSGGGNGSSSSLSTSNITKAYFFSRKSKRKEEGKNSKNSRLQSPLKDASSGSGGVGLLQQQPASNSLFYLNTVDLSGASSGQTSTSSLVAPTKAATSMSHIGASGSGSGVGDEEASSPVSLLKDKERLSAKIRELGLDFFTEDFEGITVSTTKCLSCETITEQKESMIDIAVPVPISGYDSTDYTEKPCSFIQNSCITREYFRGENKYRCEKCTGYTEAIRSISYEVLPRLLVIQLSRFSGGMEKINSYIPTSFTLQCFCSKCCELSDANKLHIYKLYSVITHVGATMSVGHYIAYTSSLDLVNEYINCPKDRRASHPTQQQQQQQQTPNGQVLHNNGNVLALSTQSSASAASVAASALASSGTSLIKKMKFGRSKASSSGDMSKNVKNVNGNTSKTITNGIGKLSMNASATSSVPTNTTCHSLNCCATRLCGVHQQQHQSTASGSSDLSEEALQNGSNHANYNNLQYSSGYGSTGRGGTGAKNSYSSCANVNASASFASASSSSASSPEPIWYMCDDDKIKAMTQREFEELLSPSRKITITPYLLFYCKFDLHSTTTPPKSVLPSQINAAANATTSWQQPNELPSGGAGASLLKM